MRYLRANVQGGTFFFTVALADRSSTLLTDRVELLRAVMRLVRQRHPFEIVAMVVMPDHLHAIWQLPEGDAAYPQRWALIKSGFSRGIPKLENIGASRMAKRERGIWQRRYWEHQIRDDRNLQSHVDYIHHNPVKHGYVKSAVDWPYSSIHRYICAGWLPADWGVAREVEGDFGE